MLCKLNLYLNGLSWWVVVTGALTLGLAPFTPPHLWKHVQSISKGQPLNPLDYFDFAYHLFPWLVLAAKSGLKLLKPPHSPKTLS